MKAIWIFIIIVAAITGLHARKLNQQSNKNISITSTGITTVNKINSFQEKDSTKNNLINGAFYLQLNIGAHKLPTQ